MCIGESGACSLARLAEIRGENGEKYIDTNRGDFLEERSMVDGRMGYTHERLRKARRALSSLLSKGLLFAYLDPALAPEGPFPGPTTG